MTNDGAGGTPEDEAGDPAPSFSRSILTEPREPGSPVESLDGRLWGRVVFAPPTALGDDGLPVDEVLGCVAAESETGAVQVWDQTALFKALFPPEG